MSNTYGLLKKRLHWSLWGCGTVSSIFKKRKTHVILSRVITNSIYLNVDINPIFTLRKSAIDPEIRDVKKLVVPITRFANPVYDALFSSPAQSKIYEFTETNAAPTKNPPMMFPISTCHSVLAKAFASVMENIGKKNKNIDFFLPILSENDPPYL